MMSFEVNWFSEIFIVWCRNLLSPFFRKYSVKSMHSVVNYTSTLFSRFSRFSTLCSSYKRNSLHCLMYLITDVNECLLKSDVLFITKLVKCRYVFSIIEKRRYKTCVSEECTIVLAYYTSTINYFYKFTTFGKKLRFLKCFIKSSSLFQLNE